MRAALSEAAQAAHAGERADGAVAVLDEAMVAHGRESVRASGDPTAHAVLIAVREAATRLGRRSLAGLTVFCVVEPCAMCVGALQQADADGVVYALADPRLRGLPVGRPPRGRQGPAAPARRRLGHPARGRRRPAAGSRSRARRHLTRNDASASMPGRSTRRRPNGNIARARRPNDAIPRAPCPGFARLAGGEVSEWLKVPLSKSGVRKHRGFESHPLRQRPIARAGRRHGEVA